MKNKTWILKTATRAAIVGAVTLALSACAGGLSTFGADLGKQSSPLGDIRLPYTAVSSYFGYVQPGQAPDAEVGGKNFYYLYLWVPAVAPEIGVRMLSPVGTFGTPAEGDFKAANYDEGAADMSKFFDTYITFERAVEVLSPEDIATKAATATWHSYATNDDSSEMPDRKSVV